MTDENIVPPSEHPVKIRWLNAAVEQSSTIQKPVAQHPQMPAIKTNKVTAPSVVTKTRTKVPSATNIVRFIDQPPAASSAISVDTSIQSSKGIKELSPEDKLKIANLIKELARIGHEKEIVESKLEQERKLFETQMKTLLTDYDKLMKDNQKILIRYNETKILLNEYEKRSRIKPTPPPPSNEFPNPQRSSTPINVPPKEPPTNHSKNEKDLIQSSHTTHSIISEQFQLKQSMMEKQLELLHKQQQILEKELQQRNINLSMEQPVKSSSTSTIQTTTRATSPLKHEIKKVVVERATSPAKVATKPIVKISDKQVNRPIQTQRFTMNNNDEDLLILSLNESLHEQVPNKSQINHKPQFKNNNRMNANADSEEQNLLKDIFFIC
ncbi:unnamed protein product [Rotaria socialis]|uniref:Uncharacterized protein n=3 Tax=Rotaria socialis TaxID=392032 RepID=A0A818N1R0_9BILA|nr:unnamed protein product [Rotaria socialis]CAF3371586.1 unnamed protein product [Rotaria socialis]CAF3391705.1 unnamed protein product [Rotaria socialis]CAF3598208.1 unnamed protein product [Rotaria socialis]CAF4201167.1 unnamed protein product [Rotaria socialis]